MSEKDEQMKLRWSKSVSVPHTLKYIVSGQVVRTT